ncbi:MAG: 50S ribosomal protein L22 [Candidatus Omnitrophica bacterium]|nr:50S ribosomal protein L22 [Candidatus Omnitrophota bacterium]
MIAKAKVRHLRMTARKARMVIELVRGKSARAALTILAHTPKRAAAAVNKIVRSAIANARQQGAAEDGLYISRIFADEGTMWKRFRAASFGRGTRIRKRTCHITVELDSAAPAAVSAGNKATRAVKRKQKIG